MKALKRVLKDVEFLKAVALFVFAMVLLGGLQAYAQAAVVAPPTFLDGILNWIKGLNAGVVGSILAVVAEISMRMVPTQKALSLLVPVKYVCDGMVVLMGWLSGLLSILITSLNNSPPKA